MRKERIDVLLVEQGFFDSREKAKRAIMAGIVYANTARILKAGEKVAADVEIMVKGKTIPYVSRGGLKLEKAIQVFGLDLTGKIVLDIGASTGGFTDCSLQNGAKFVYALDVGTNQLDWKLRNDERVLSLEKTNFRYATQELFVHGQPEFATIDVSFISLSNILPNLANILTANGEVMALIKPQFEAGREFVGKKGIVREPKVHQMVLEKTVAMMNDTGFAVQAIAHSPITGGEGNIEFIAYLQYGVEQAIEYNYAELVKEAHSQFQS
ncbi:MAG: TlyA family RNA methyltransferase [Culicoidibacterales bacterium]